MGDAAKIRAAVVRKQKTDARDAAHLLDMLCTNRFPKIWRPSATERDLRQLLWHRQTLVWMRGAVKNQMHALPWASYRRQELLRMFDGLQDSVRQLDQAVELAAKSQPLAARLMTHPGVGRSRRWCWC
jgi:transposase